jgi:hypothetical protein
VAWLIETSQSQQASRDFQHPSISTVLPSLRRFSSMPSSPKFRPSSPFRRRDKPYEPDSSRDAKSAASEPAFGERWSPGPRPSLSMTGKDGARRQSSIQFSTGAAEAAIRKESLTAKLSNVSAASQRRMSSPPPPR